MAVAAHHKKSRTSIQRMSLQGLADGAIVGGDGNGLGGKAFASVVRYKLLPEGGSS